MKAILSTLILLSGCVGNALAHDAWIVEDGPAHLIAYGHHDKTEPYDPKKVGTVSAFDASGKPVTTRVTQTADSAAVETAAPAALLVLEFDNGFWSKVDGKSRNQKKTEVPGATEGSRSLKFGKTVLGWSPALIQPVGARLELVPAAAAAPKAGEVLTFTVMYEGKPLSGAKVSTGGNHDGKPLISDDRGQVQVPVVRGPQALSVGHSVPYDGPEADKLNMAANFRFTVR